MGHHFDVDTIVEQHGGAGVSRPVAADRFVDTRHHGNHLEVVVVFLVADDGKVAVVLVEDVEGRLHKDETIALIGFASSAGIVMMAVDEADSVGVERHQVHVGEAGVGLEDEQILGVSQVRGRQLEVGNRVELFLGKILVDTVANLVLVDVERFVGVFG